MTGNIGQLLPPVVVVNVFPLRVSLKIRRAEFVRAFIAEPPLLPAALVEIELWMPQTVERDSLIALWHC